MINKKLAGLCLALLAIAGVAQAQVDVNTAPQRLKVLPVSSKIEFKKEAGAAGERVGEIKTKVLSNLQLRGEEMSNRFGKMFEQMDNLLTRAKSRIEKLAQAGADVSAARAKASAAEAAIASAKAKAETLKTSLATALGSAKPREAWQPLKGSLQTVLAEIKTARQALVDLIKELGTTAKTVKPLSTDNNSSTQ